MTSPILILLVYISLYLGVHGELNMVLPTDTCIDTARVEGKAIYCATGNCYGGSNIFDPSSSCYNYVDICLDTDLTCDSTSIFKRVSGPGNCPEVDAGIGFCGSASNWGRSVWQAACCWCPAGYVAAKPGCFTPGNYNWEVGKSGWCVGCDGPGEVLVPDPLDGFVCSSQCKLTPAQKEWIKKNEGWCPGPGQCSGALGYGHDCTANDCASIKTPMTKAEGNSLFEKDWPKYAQFVTKSLPNVDKLNSNQFAALVDYAFNTGSGDPKYLHKYFLSDMSKGNYDNVCERIKTAWTYPDLNKQVCNDKGKKCTWVPRPNGPVPGKINRRKNQAAKCSTPTTVSSGC